MEFFFIPTGISFSDQHGKDFTKQFLPDNKDYVSKETALIYKKV